MERRVKKDSFWLSYSDLMTSLFFIMLVLLLSSIIVTRPVITKGQTLKDLIDSLRQVVIDHNMWIDSLQRSNDSINVGYGELQNILQLEGQFKVLSQSTTLRYDEGKRTFFARELEGIEIFREEDDQIKIEYLEKVKQVGIDLEKVLQSLNQKNPDFRFLLVIEGNSANNVNKPMSKDREYNYNLSYRRALALYTFWRKNYIDLRRYNTEILICGSGLNGINKDELNESNNKRFVIQILPKVSRPQTSDGK